MSPQVKVSNIPGKKLEHQGIKVQLLGQIELLSARGYFHDFVALGKNMNSFQASLQYASSFEDCSAVEEGLLTQCEIWPFLRS